jgi:hypothetical protein
MRKKRFHPFAIFALRCGKIASCFSVLSVFIRVHPRLKELLGSS